jgi:hypothetical protein
MTSNIAIDVTDARFQSALSELQELIRVHYPSATFVVSEGDDPEGVYLSAVVDLDDPDEVMDVVVNRLLEIEIDDGLPIYVIPTRTQERIEECLRRQQVERVPQPVREELLD